MTSFAASDRLTASYLAFTLVLIAWRADRIPGAASIAALNASLLLLVWWLSRSRARGTRAWSVVADWYPLALFVVFFEQIGSLVHAIASGWRDSVLIAIDYAIFGVHPGVWIEQFAGYWMTEYMQFSYLMYFPLTAGAAVWLRLRHGRSALGQLLLASCVAYYICYVIFLIFPIEGPFHTLRELQRVELRGGVFTAVIEWVERYGRVHGGAFPSAHVAGSVVSWLVLWRYSARAGWLLTPLILSITVATVYGRYHYAIDVPAGVLVAIAGVVVAVRVEGASQ
jgi:membrane-associated phospholipid phosphatase